jgi:hypothetical protein
MAQQTAVQMLIEHVKKQGFDLEYEMETSFLDTTREQKNLGIRNSTTTKRTSNQKNPNQDQRPITRDG